MSVTRGNSLLYCLFIRVVTQDDPLSFFLFECLSRQLSFFLSFFLSFTFQLPLHCLGSTDGNRNCYYYYLKHALGRAVSPASVDKALSLGASSYLGSSDTLSRLQLAASGTIDVSFLFSLLCFTFIRAVVVI